MTTKVIIGVPQSHFRTVIETQDLSPEGNWETSATEVVEIGDTRIIEGYITSTRRYRVIEQKLEAVAD